MIGRLIVLGRRCLCGEVGRIGIVGIGCSL